MYIITGSILFFIHALIHVNGFVKAKNIKRYEIIKRPGIVWLVCSNILGIAGLLLLSRIAWWWIPAVVGVITSQALIISMWKAAKAGTLVNIILLPGIVIAMADYVLNNNTGREMNIMRMEALANPPESVTTEKAAGLPPVIQKWMKRSGVIGKTIPRVVTLQQTGEMRMSQTTPWMPMNAGQVFNTATPAFIWNAEVTRQPWFYFRGIDRFSHEGGNMDIRLFSIFHVAGGDNDKIDQGTMLRFLAEMIWFPASATSPYITWQQIDDTTATAILKYSHRQVSGRFTFDTSGKFTAFEAQRYLGGEADSKLETWYIPATDWQVMEGVFIPTAGDAYWKLKDGNFNYFKWRITEVHYD